MLTMESCPFLIAFRLCIRGFEEGEVKVSFRSLFFAVLSVLIGLPKVGNRMATASCMYSGQKALHSVSEFVKADQTFSTSLHQALAVSSRTSVANPFAFSQLTIQPSPSFLLLPIRLHFKYSKYLQSFRPIDFQAPAGSEKPLDF